MLSFFRRLANKFQARSTYKHINRKEPNPEPASGDTFIDVSRVEESITKLTEQYKDHPGEFDMICQATLDIHKARLSQMYAIFDQVLQNFRNNLELSAKKEGEAMTPEQVIFDLANPTKTIKELEKYFQGMSIQAIEIEIEARITPHEKEFEVLEKILTSVQRNIEIMRAMKDGRTVPQNNTHFRFSASPNDDPLKLYRDTREIIINAARTNDSVQVLSESFAKKPQLLIAMANEALSHPNLQHHFPDDMITFKEIFEKALLQTSSRNQSVLH